jgi:alkyl hydroperoxide reductase subunit D
MSIDSLKDALPDYAKDLRLNLPSVLSTPGMTAGQIWGTALSCAIAARSAPVLQAVAAAAAEHLDAGQISAAKTAAALMAMNNVYYRFTHLVEHQSPDYKTMPARLRMNGLAQHGTDPLDFELWCLAVSAVNGCGRCLEAHEAVVLKKGASKELVQNVVRIGAVVQAVAVTLDAAAVLGDRPG